MLLCSLSLSRVLDHLADLNSTAYADYTTLFHLDSFSDLLNHFIQYVFISYQCLQLQKYLTKNVNSFLFIIFSIYIYPF